MELLTDPSVPTTQQEDVDNAGFLQNENILVIQKYFRYRYPSLNKILNDKEKFKKFVERWNRSLIMLNSSGLNIKEKTNLKIGTKNPTIMARRNSTTNSHIQEKEWDCDNKLSQEQKENIYREKPVTKSKAKSKSIIESKTSNIDKKINKTNSNNEEKKSLNSKHSNRRSTTALITNTKDEENKLIPKKFICNNAYPDIKQSLISRGWSENIDKESLDFNFLWTLKTKDVPQTLTKNQIVNHFSNSSEITMKSGLTKNIKNLIFNNIDVDNFYPRCFELFMKNDMDDFLEDFKTTKAISILKKFSNNDLLDLNSTVGKSVAYEDKLKVALDICERKLILLEINSNSNSSSELFSEKFNMYSDLKSCFNHEIKFITDKEWFIISEEDCITYTKVLEKLENKVNGHNKKIKRSNSLIVQNTGSSKLVPNDKPQPTKEITTDQTQIDSTEFLDKYKPIVDSILVRLKKNFPQHSMCGNKNIWILKPSGLSRGRGITCINNLNEIIQFLKKESNQYMAQKYIENPLIILGRKFDIRQWVLVTDMDPLTVWMYDTPYLRFGAEDYIPEEFSNLFSHLTNNSVVKYSKNFENEKIQGNMWDIHSFSEFLKLTNGRDVWKDELQEKIKKIIISSLESIKKIIKNRKNSFELFGYDIMVDIDLNTWLIEVNCSPAMDYSTPVTEFLVKQMSEDLIKVVIDYNDAKPVDRPNISTGSFVKIHSGEDKLSPIFIPNNLN